MPLYWWQLLASYFISSLRGSYISTKTIVIVITVFLAPSCQRPSVLNVSGNWSDRAGSCITILVGCLGNRGSTRLHPYCFRPIRMIRGPRPDAEVFSAVANSVEREYIERLPRVFTITLAYAPFASVKPCLRGRGIAVESLRKDGGTANMAALL